MNPKLGNMGLFLLREDLSIRRRRIVMAFSYNYIVRKVR